MSGPVAGAKARWMKRAYGVTSFLLVGLVLAQFALAAMILVWCFDPDFVRRLGDHPVWSFDAWLNLLLSALMALACGFGMLTRKRWAPAAYCAGAVIAIGSNLLSPYPNRLLLGPHLALVAFTGVFYLAFREFEDRVHAVEQEPPVWTPLGVLEALATILLYWR